MAAVTWTSTGEMGVGLRFLGLDASWEMANGVLDRVFEMVYDVVTAFTIRRLVLALVFSSLLVGSGSYVVYPDFTATMVANAMGQDPNAAFQPVEDGVNVTYVKGTITGSGGPTGGSVQVFVLARANFRTGRIAGNVTGTFQGQSLDGYIQGEVDDDGTVVGGGRVTALRVATVKYRFTGTVAGDYSSADGTWRSTTNLEGDGRWQVESMSREEFDRLHRERFEE